MNHRYIDWSHNVEIHFPTEIHGVLSQRMFDRVKSPVIKITCAIGMYSKPSTTTPRLLKVRSSVYVLLYELLRPLGIRL